MNCIGDENFKSVYVKRKVEDWIDEIKVTFTQGLQHRYTYIMRTISNIETLMIPLENTIRSILLPALLNGYSCSDMERNLFSLPAKFGGLGAIKVV